MAAILGGIWGVAEIRTPQRVMFLSGPGENNAWGIPVFGNATLHFCR